MDRGKKIPRLAIILLLPVVVLGALGDQELTVDGAKLIWNNNSQTFSIAASGSMSASVNYIWPVADATADGQALLSNSSGVLRFGVPTTSASHNILSATHDATANAVTRGSIIYGNSTPKWDELVVGTGFLKADGTDVTGWSTITLTTDTTGNYVAIVADGTGIDGTATGEGSTYTPTFDATELDALTWSDNANASNIWTFNVSGTDHTMTAGNGLMTFSNDVTAAGLTITNATVIGSDSVVFQPNTDSTTFFQILDADGGTPILVVNTTDERVGIGVTPVWAFHVESAVLGQGMILDNSAGNVSLSLQEQGNGVGAFVGDIPRFIMKAVSGRRIHLGANNQSNHIVIATDGNVGFNEDAAETPIEMTHATPYLTLHNSTHEDSDGGRESRLNFKGEQSGGEETTLIREEIGHDGTSDDEKGYKDWFVNAGSDGDSPTFAMRLDSVGLGIGTKTQVSLLEADGAIGLAIETVTGNTTLDKTHSTVLVNASGNVTITLPTAASSYNNTDGIGRIYRIKKIDVDADTVTIDGNSSETIDGGTTAVITKQHETITIQSDGTEWWIL